MEIQVSEVWAMAVELQMGCLRTCFATMAQTTTGTASSEVSGMMVGTLTKVIGRIKPVAMMSKQASILVDSV
jgi:hypothetical protein